MNNLSKCIICNSHLSEAAKASIIYKFYKCSSCSYTCTFLSASGICIHERLFFMTENTRVYASSSNSLHDIMLYVYRFNNGEVFKKLFEIAYTGIKDDISQQIHFNDLKKIVSRNIKLQSIN